MKSKSEIAALYMPDATVSVARANLLNSIKRNPQLLAELETAGYTKRAKLLTPKQIQIIFDYLGEP